MPVIVEFVVLGFTFFVYLMTQGKLFESRFQNSKLAKAVLILFFAFSFGFFGRDFVGLISTVVSSNNPSPKKSGKENSPPEPQRGPQPAPQPAPRAQPESQAVLTSATEYFQRGVEYRSRGLALRAIADFNNALRLNPEFLPALAARGNLHLQMDENALAVKDFERVLSIDPKATEVSNLLQVAKDRIGETTLAPLWTDINSRR